MIPVFWIKRYTIWTNIYLFIDFWSLILPSGANFGKHGGIQTSQAPSECEQNNIQGFANRGWGSLPYFGPGNLIPGTNQKLPANTKLAFSGRTRGFPAALPAINYLRGLNVLLRCVLKYQELLSNT